MVRGSCSIALYYKTVLDALEAGYAPGSGALGPLGSITETEVVVHFVKEVGKGMSYPNNIVGLTVKDLAVMVVLAACRSIDKNSGDHDSYANATGGGNADGFLVGRVAMVVTTLVAE